MDRLTGFSVTPTRNRPSSFASEGNVFMAEWVAVTEEMNDIIIPQIESAVDSCEEQSAIATTQAGIATTQAGLAESAAVASTASANAVLWVSGATVNQWDVVISPANGQSYRRITATGSGSTDPANDPTNYEPISTNGGIIRVERTSNTQLVRANWRNLIDITSGTFPQTFAECHLLGNGWWCIIRNSGTGDITLDPDSSETIDGLDTFIMYPGEARLIQCDGSALRSIILSPFYLVVENSLTFRPPPGYACVGWEAWGAGGSGAKRSSTTYDVSGGGGGAYAAGFQALSHMGSSEILIVGSGGAASTSDNEVGEDGGDSTLFGFTINGGVGGHISTNNQDAIGGAALTPAWISEAGGGSNVQSAAASKVYAGCGGGGISDTFSTVETAGSSLYGGDGGDASVSSSGTDGQIPGGGGGATRTGEVSGAGARGEIRLWGII